ncbi:hypothetical protein GCM10009753_13670 [Streptantibioticus ferralitis]
MASGMITAGFCIRARVVAIGVLPCHIVSCHIESDSFVTALTDVTAQTDVTALTERDGRM